MNQYISNAIAERIELPNFIMKRVEPVADPAGARKKEVFESIMADLKMLRDVSDIIELKFVRK